MPATQSFLSPGLKGCVSVPGDKSVSHRSLMLGALAVGESRVTGLLEGEDVLATAAAMRAMGAEITRLEDGSWQIYGVGVGGLREPDDVLDMGNSGTSTRLLMGLVATHPITATFTGDGSLRGRPMQRIITPIEAFGARVSSRSGGRLPLMVEGAEIPVPQHYVTPMASAQVKSAVLLAGLNTRGITSVTESVATRDHTERMLSAMGAEITVETGPDGARTVSLTGYPELKPLEDLTVPGDISSAAFLMVAASILPGSDVTLTGVGLNPLRTGVVEALKAMGANIAVENPRDASGEPIGDIRIKATTLKAVTELPVHPSTMIDEFPVLFVAAANADGVSRFTGLKELRVKESDRLAAMAAALMAAGVTVREFEDGLEIEGRPGDVKGGGTVVTHLDHRIAMSGLILGLTAKDGMTIDDASPIETSFPGFANLMRSLGADIQAQGGDSQ